MRQNPNTENIIVTDVKIVVDFRVAVFKHDMLGIATCTCNCRTHMCKHVVHVSKPFYESRFELGIPSWNDLWNERSFDFFFKFFSKKGNCKRIRNFYCIFVRHIYVYTFNFLFVLGWGSGPPPKEFEFRWPTI